ncbi:hypothetical protein I302_101561 [Kwoniella bestiolae CBS 10118]|uniref:Phosphatidylinositol N-acetylglucosaminyltransferase subunit H conserved domain-containing protein n=1 Tax=Kwoniella bestiolae CBS 10118 TaxID=1296100 RepID=A0A1B9GCK3_9TREE|nr:hypothetical protein I302_00244 [Kwoniella bestiolae CBS 10118]OCF28755.1 hypothetical protein I302_00244 [Kwoniella bestiolae CBS 10118]
MDLIILPILIWVAWRFEIWTDVKAVLRAQAICSVWIILAICYMYSKCNTVLYESITPVPNLGIQLSTVRGLSFPLPSKRVLIPLKSSHNFIPLTEVSTVILNQALTGFSVKYYLGVVKTDGKGVVVAFNHIRPNFDVLREVYHGVRETMFNEYERITPKKNG